MNRIGWARRGTLRVDRFLTRCWDAHLLAKATRHVSFALLRFNRADHFFSGSNLSSKNRPHDGEERLDNLLSINDISGGYCTERMSAPPFFWLSLFPSLDTQSYFLNDRRLLQTTSFQASLFTPWAHDSDDTASIISTETCCLHTAGGFFSASLGSASRCPA